MKARGSDYRGDSACLARVSKILEFTQHNNTSHSCFLGKWIHRDIKFEVQFVWGREEPVLKGKARGSHCIRANVVHIPLKNWRRRIYA